MRSEIRPSAPWGMTNLWPGVHRSPFVIVLAGVESSEIVDAALTDRALTEVAVLRFEPGCSPPCDALLWRLEMASGESLNLPGLLRRYWHRPPYAMTLRLVQYQPGSVVPEVLDEGTLGSRGRHAAFKIAVDRLAMRFVRDAAQRCGRGSAGAPPAAGAHGLPGWLDAIRTTWHDRLMVERWSAGTAIAPIDSVLSGQGLGDITWANTEIPDRYAASSLRPPGTDAARSEKVTPGDVADGRVIPAPATTDSLARAVALPGDGYDHARHRIFPDGDIVYYLPESTRRGATRIRRLENNGQLILVCDPAPHSRLADPILFQWNGLYWLACTDLDLGRYDNLCLLHAPGISGPWTPHARWPVKIDVRSARPAGRPFSSGGRLFRPGQDCSSTFGSAIAIHEIQELSETDFRETLVTVLKPDRTGPFPHGLGALVHDGDRFWLNGKHFALDLGLFRRKLLGGARRALAGRGWTEQSALDTSSYPADV